MRKKINFRRLARDCALLASEKKARDILILDIRKLTPLANYFVICSAESNIQVRSIADFIISELKKTRVFPLHTEGMTTAQWVLLDYGGVIVHIFYDLTRKFYNLERLWADAKEISIKPHRKRKK